jgi:hypothetical protein
VTLFLKADLYGFAVIKGGIVTGICRSRGSEDQHRKKQQERGGFHAGRFAQKRWIGF